MCLCWCLRLKRLCFLCFCLSEIEAKEACDWLRAAGFPQYAQLYEGNVLFRTRGHAQVNQNLAGFTQRHAFCSFLPLDFSPWLTVLFFPSSCCPCLLLACCFLFPGFSSCPERWVMGKALLSLLGLVQPFSPHSSTFPLPCCRHVHSPLSLTAVSSHSVWIPVSYRLSFCPSTFHFDLFAIKQEHTIVGSHAVEGQTGNGLSNLRRVP